MRNQPIYQIMSLDLRVAVDDIDNNYPEIVDAQVLPGQKFVEQLQIGEYTLLDCFGLGIIVRRKS